MIEQNWNIQLHHTIISYNRNFSWKLEPNGQPQPQPQPLYPKLVKTKITMYIINTTYNIIKDKNLNSILSSFLSRWWIFVFSYVPQNINLTSCQFNLLIKLGDQERSDWASERFPLGVSAGVWLLELRNPPSSPVGLRPNPSNIQASDLNKPLNILILTCPLLGRARALYALSLDMVFGFSIFELDIEVLKIKRAWSWNRGKQRDREKGKTE